MTPSCDQAPAAPLRGPSLPATAGLGLKTQHIQQILAERPALGFFEVHAENYMVAGGPFHHYLNQIHQHYPLSIHGVGMSIGGEQPLDSQHLERLALLLERHQPEAFSEHLAWSSHGDNFYNDLLPVIYDQSSLERVCDHIDQLQERLQRRLLLENPSSYVQFEASHLDEASFIHAIIQRTGCGLLLDVNNLYISCVNHNCQPLHYLDSLPLHAVGQIHLAGFSEDRDSLGDRLLIDSHGAAVDQAVWQLYDQLLQRIGPTPTLIEWDNDVPPLAGLLEQAGLAEQRLARLRQAHLETQA